MTTPLLQYCYVCNEIQYPNEITGGDCYIVHNQIVCADCLLIYLYENKVIKNLGADQYKYDGITLCGDCMVRHLVGEDVVRKTNETDLKGEM